MNRKLVLLLTAIFLAGVTGMDIPAQAVPGAFGYDLQKDMHRNSNSNNNQQQQNENNAQNDVSIVNKDLTVDDIFDSSVNFNKVYYPNASMKSAATKYKKGNYTGCLQELYTIAKKNPNNAMAYYYAAMAYTKIGSATQADKAYQKVISLNPNPIIIEYAEKGRNCLAGNPACTISDPNVKQPEGTNQEADELDKFIAAPYGNGMSPEMNTKYKQQQLDAIQNKINNGQTLSPEDIQKMRDIQNNKSEALPEDKLAMADSNTMPSNEEVLGALNVLKRAGLNISTNTETSVSQSSQPAYTPDPQIQQMSMLLNGNNNTNNDPFMSMLPYMMEGEGKNVNPQLMQTMMVNSMMNSINGMNSSNNN